MAVHRIEEVSEASRQSAISALTLAFIRDPVMRWLYSTPKDYLDHFPAFAAAFGSGSFESGTAWLHEDGGGAALWLPPGVHPDNEAIEAAFGPVDPSKQEALGGILERMDELHPDEPHWYLPIIGVDSAYQGHGIGAELMEGALALCDEDGVIAYLESSNPANISLYQRHGFEVIEEIRVGDAPVVTPMQRPAR